MAKCTNQFLITSFKTITVTVRDVAKTHEGILQIICQKLFGEKAKMLSASYGPSELLFNIIRYGR